MKNLAIKILIVIIVIAVAILGIKVMSNKENTTTDAKQYGKQDIIALLNRGTEYDNYSYQETIGDVQYLHKIRQDKVITTIDGGNVYIDFTNKEKIILVNSTTKTAVVYSLKDEEISEMKNKYKYGKIYIELLNNDKTTYNYLKQENCNGLDCVVIQIKAKSTDVINYNSISVSENAEIYDLDLLVWIDKKSGIVAKVTVNGNGEEKSSIDYNLKLDYITEEDVKRPSLDGYKVYNQ